MTFQIRKDQLPCSRNAFAAAVEAHAAALNEYRAHLRGVAEDAENPNLQPDERRVAFPGPDAPNLVKNAITLDGATDQYVPDYELVGPPLAEKKQALFAEVSKMEAEAIEANIPQAKRRHWQFRMQDIAALDADAFKAARTVDPSASLERLQEVVARCRHPEDAAFLTVHEERATKEAAIQRWAAKLHADIDDLTEETVDSFVVTPFNG